MLSLSHPPYHFNQCNQFSGRQSRNNYNTQQSQQQQQIPSNFNFDFTSSTPLSILDNINTLANGVLPNDAMQSDLWGSVARFTPEKTGRYSHQRESSLSSLGSTGPASPYSQNTSNPQIAVTNDSIGDDLPDLYSSNDNSSQGGSFYQMSKPVGHYSGYQQLDQSIPEMAYPVTISGPSGKPRVDRSNLIPAPELSNSGSRSQPASVASSIAGDSPATPTVSHVEAIDKRRKGRSSNIPDSLTSSDSPLPLLEGYGNVPKLDRTMTDVYGDELYSPNFAITSTPPQQQMTAMSPPNDIFNQRLNAANSQHLHVSHSPNSTASRGRSSPFSPYGQVSNDFNAPAQGMPMGSAQRVREQGKAQQDVQMFQQQVTRGRTQPETPKTISPKDAILEFNEAEGDANFPLFPQTTSLEMDQMAKSMVPTTHFMPPTSNAQMNYLQPQMSNGMDMHQQQQMPQQYPFVSRAQPINSNSPPRLGSSGSSVDSRSSTPSHFMGRPMGVTADGGTYTCTYHGCTLRFETPALLQKHKREGHRQSHGLTAPPRPHEGMQNAAVLGSQAGPHRCDRINPSTGKPCNTVFSRPYDLTRHEDTIHNARKQKVRCDICTEEKTFSRADALTRHYRVCHPDMELPGKRRRLN